MSLLATAADLFKQHLGDSGSNLDVDTIMSAMSDLFNTESGELNIGAIIEKVQAGGLANMVNSWLGDGQNEAMSADSILGIFGNDQISQFASQLNLDSSSAAEGLSNMIPDLLDKNNEGGNLAGAAASMLGGLFK